MAARRHYDPFAADCLRRSRGNTFVVVDGKRRRRYDRASYLAFAPEGHTPVYAAARDRKVFTVVDDDEAAHHYDAIWMPPGEKLRFVGRKTFRYLALRGDGLYRVEEELP